MPWGERTYLIANDEVIEFCNAINRGREPRPGAHGFFLLRRGNEEKQADGTPVLPAQFKGYLLDEPIQAEIIGAGKSTLRPGRANWKFKDTEAMVNVGKGDRILPGMKLHGQDPDISAGTVKILAVDENTSTGVVVQLGEGNGPQIGWKLSTRAHWAESLEGNQANKVGER